MIFLRGSDRISFVEVARVDEIPEGKMKHVEVGENEILIAKVDGKFYATSDRCGHMSARLSMGELRGTAIVCPLHGSRFDVTTGEKILGPIPESAPGLKECPEETQKSMQSIAELVELAKTHDLPTFRVKVEDERILVDV